MAQHTTETPTGGAGEPRPRRALPDEGPDPAVPDTQRRGTPLPENTGSGPAADPLTADVAAARPPRPQMDRPPAPTSLALVRPGIVGLVLGLFYLGLGAGAVGVASALLWRSGARENLLAMMAESVADEARKQQVAELVQYGTVAAVVLLLLVQLALVVRLATGRRGARPGLVVVVAAQVLLYLFTADIVRGTGWEGVVVLVGLGVHAVTAVIATLLSWAPPVGDWLSRSSAVRQR